MSQRPIPEEDPTQRGRQFQRNTGMFGYFINFSSFDEHLLNLEENLTNLWKYVVDRKEVISKNLVLFCDRFRLKSIF